MIRPARADDPEAIADVHAASWRAAYPHIFPADTLVNLSEQKLGEMWRERINRAPSSVLVLQLEERVRGFIQLGPTRDPDMDENRVGEVYALYLHPGWWGRGHGRNLWNAAHLWLITREVAVVSLWVLEDNEVGRSFYQKIGFQGDPETRRVMERAGKLVPELRYTRSVGDQ